MTQPHSAIKVLIMAGGTGGHVFPALATAKELQRRSCEVEWLGTERGIEANIVPKNNITLHLLNIAGVRGKSLKTKLLAPLQIIAAVAEARKLLQSVKPNVVLGMGGYVSGPGGVAAKLLGIPLVIHEQNAKPGTTNKLLARVANRVLTAFENALPAAKCIGNPVREDITAIAEPQMRLAGRTGPIRLLVLGGSLGAQAINDLVPEALASENLKDRFSIVHQSGVKHLDFTEKKYRELGVPADVVAFIEDMAERLSWADLVVCRSGALTVAELSIAGVAAVLVPFPYAIDDHQTANANWLVEKGAAVLRQQADLSKETLKELLLELSDNRQNLVNMAIAARSAALPNATQACAQVCMEVANG